MPDPYIDASYWEPPDDRVRLDHCECDPPESGDHERRPDGLLWCGWCNAPVAAALSRKEKA